MTIAQPSWKTWKHVVKLDPDRLIEDSVLQELGRIGTDAALVGGTQGVTFEKTDSLVHRLRCFAPNLPVWQEISEQDAISPDTDGYGIPIVLNTRRIEWLIGRHVAAIHKYGALIPWDRTLIEGYLILNPHAAVAKLTDVVMPETAAEAAAFAVAAERIFGMQTLYVEYSGDYGSIDWLREIRQATHAHLIYGGGIDSAERAAEMAAVADTIVVGNAIYDKGIEFVRDTVRAIK